jgi:endonuclease IV
MLHMMLAVPSAGMHINDSKCALGSRRDRHENIGQGMIGLGVFECIMNDSRLDGNVSPQ